MGWDDSDEDAEDEWDEAAIEAKLQAQLKEKERQRRRDEGLSSESEKEEEPADKPKPKPKPKPKAEKKEPEKVLTAEEKKLLQRKLEEEQDQRLAGDLFAGFEAKKEAEAKRKADEAREAEEEEERRREAAKPKIIINDAFDNLELKVQTDVENLVRTCLDKVEKGKAKSGPLWFCTGLLKSLEDALATADISEIEKIVAEIVKEKKVQKGAVLAKDNKANTKLSKTTKFNAASEWEEVYGGGEGDEEWTQEEWDDWYAQQEGGGAGAPKKATGAKW